MPITDSRSFTFAFTDARVSYDTAGRSYVTGPDGVRQEVTGVANLVFTDGSIQERDGKPLVDDLYYYAKYLDVWAAHIKTGLDADDHYNQYGWHEGRDPDAYFSASAYLTANPDVRSAGVDPLTHYDQFGFKEGRNPGPAFDTKAYLAANPDVKAAGVDPLAHFLQFGAAEGRHAVPVTPAASGPYAPDGLDYGFYLTKYSDVRADGIDADLHYDRFGWHEGRYANAFFDTSGYLATYTDVAGAGVDPLRHYHVFGFKEGRDPGPGFDTKAYLAANPDVAAAGVDPVLHYLQFGKAEGRAVIAESLKDVDGAADFVFEGATTGTATGVTFSWGGWISPNLRYAITMDSSGGGFAIDAATGKVTVADGSRIDYESSSTYTITVTATDDTQSLSKAVTIAVGDVNDNAPVFTSSATPSVPENTKVVVTLTSTDPDTAGSPTTYMISGGADAGKFQIVAGNQLQFITAPDYEGHGSAASSNSYAVQVSASDGSNTGTQNLTVAVTDVNDVAPTFTSSATPSVAENMVQVVALTTTDPDTVGKNPPVFTITGGADADKFKIDGNALQFVTAPDYEAPGSAAKSNTYTVQVSANDGANVTPQTLMVTVTNVNDNAPVAKADAYATLEDSTLLVTARGVLANDSDADGDALKATLVTGPGHGQVTLNSDGSFSYVPNTNYNGVDSFTYKANDGKFDSNPSTVTINVTPVNHAPTAHADAVSATAAGSGTGANAGTNPSFNVITAAGETDTKGVDTDPDAGDTLTVQGVATGTSSAPLTTGANSDIKGTYGTIHINGDGASTYTIDNTNVTVKALGPNSTPVTDTFSYTIKDQGGLTSTTQVSVAVYGTDDAPVVTTSNSTPAYGANQGAVAIDPKVNVTDVDGTKLTGAKVQITGNYVKGEDVLGLNYFTIYNVSDADGYYQITKPNYTNIYVKLDIYDGSIIFKGLDTHSHYNDLLASVTYSNTLYNYGFNTPSTMPRTVTFTATDEDGISSLGATDTIHLAPVAMPDSNINQIQSVASPPTALLAGTHGVAGSDAMAGETHLSQTQLDVIVSAALMTWAEAGLSVAQIAQLKAVTYHVGTTLPGWLGESTPGRVLISTDADGHGWFVDPTPADASEFANAVSATHLTADPTSIAAGLMDLLTTVLHEMGEQLGIRDDFAASASGTLHYGYLSEGERRLPGISDVVQAIEAQVPDTAKAAADAPIIYGAEGNDKIDAGHQGAILFGGQGSDTFVFHLPEAGLPHVAGYSAAKGDVLDISELTALVHGSDTGMRVIEDASGSFAMLQVDSHASDATASPVWTTVAQLDGVHVGEAVTVAIGLGSDAHLTHLHSALLA